MAELKIGKHIVVQRPINVKGLELDKAEDGKKELYVNKLGEPLNKIQLQKAEYKWVNLRTGVEETGKSFKSLNGKPVKAFTKSKEIDKYDSCDIMPILANAIEIEKTYHLIGDSLKAELKELGSGKGFVFKYVNSGFKIHKAVVYLQGDIILMRCVRGDLSKVDLSENIKTEEVDADEGVGQVDLSEIEI